MYIQRKKQCLEWNSTFQDRLQSDEQKKNENH